MNDDTTGLRVEDGWAEPTDPGMRGALLLRTSSYQESQRLVDSLSREGFPVGDLSIVGKDLLLVEDVHARFTLKRAVMSGGALGGWFGVGVGLVLAVINASAPLAAILTGLVLGLLFGAGAGAYQHSRNRNQRDFISETRVAAAHWEVLCATASLERARELVLEFSSKES